MSREYTLHCIDCNQTPTRCSINHGAEYFRDAYRLREHILAIIAYERAKDDLCYIEVGLMGGYYGEDLWDFLHEHYDHRMDVVDEYGEYEPIEGDNGRQSDTTHEEYAP